ncbi:MAG: PLP-dependent aminotransferase family protein [Clostridiales bacterium]
MIEIFNNIKIDKTNEESIYIQIYRELKKMILEGILLPEYKLPSIRNLSDKLSVNNVTIVSTYKKLESEGFVYKKSGSGTYVSNNFKFESDNIYELPYLFNSNNKYDNMEKNEKINFASLAPESKLFPVEKFKLVLNEVLERDKGNAFSYQNVSGLNSIKESIYQNIVSKRFIKTELENIQIISGAQQGIDIISKVLLNQGDYLVTENPSYSSAIEVFKNRKCNILSLEINEKGIDFNILENFLKKYKPKIIYTIPTFHNPTGYSYDNDKRLIFMDLVNKYNVYVIEDDYVSDLNYENNNYKSLKSIDKKDRVIFIKSFSKIFMPGLRIGFMIVPESIRDNILRAKHMTDISTSAFIQRAIDLYIRKGFWEDHFLYMADVYKKKYFKMKNAIEKNLKNKVKYFFPGGGLSIMIKLPIGYSVNNLLVKLLKRNVIVLPGTAFYNDIVVNHESIILCFASVDESRIEEGIKTISEII